MANATRYVRNRHNGVIAGVIVATPDGDMVAPIGPMDDSHVLEPDESADDAQKEN